MASYCQNTFGALYPFALQIAQDFFFFINGNQQYPFLAVLEFKLLGVSNGSFADSVDKKSDGTERAV